MAEQKDECYFAGTRSVLNSRPLDDRLVAIAPLNLNRFLEFYAE
jgi:hypothetical protein